MNIKSNLQTQMSKALNNNLLNLNWTFSHIKRSGTFISFTTPSTLKTSHIKFNPLQILVIAKV